MNPAGHQKRYVMKQDKRPALVLRFLSQIALHNDREWMAAHRGEYEEARAAFEGLTEDLIHALVLVEPAVATLTVKDCTYRFYRDTRFSPDKSPYKRHMGAYVNPKGKKSPHGGYYLHLEPGGCEIAGGSYCLEPKILRAVRESVCDRIDEFRGIVEGERFRQLFPAIGMERVKTVPKGFPRDFPWPDYIRCKDYCVGCAVGDDFFDRPDWMERAVEVFAVMKPFIDFVNDTVDDYL